MYKVFALKTALLCWAFLPLLPLSAQPFFPENGPVYEDRSVPRIDIFIHPDTLAWIYQHVESDIEWRAKFVFRSAALADTVEEIGFRLRGNTSRHSGKKSFKVSFNTFERGKRWQGFKDLNLNGEHNDPTLLRSKLSWDLLRAAGVPAPRANHVELYINGNYHGLYLNVEHINDDFAASRFGNDEGNLYKCLYPADLKFLGNDPDEYKAAFWGRRAYELGTNESTDDYTDLAHFIGILNNSSDSEFRCRIYEVFNVYDYLNTMAADVLMGNWDGYIYNKNNFYLYHNTASGRFEYIPYDLDNTWGIDWIGPDWGTRNLYAWQAASPEVRPLYSRLLNVPEFRNYYSQRIKYLLDSVLRPNVWFPKIDALKAMIEPYVQRDPYYPLSYGYTPNDFQASFEQALGGHVDYGLKPFLTTRRNSAYSQLQTGAVPPIINHIRHNPPRAGQPIALRAELRTHIGLRAVQIEYRTDNGALQNAPMYDDGLHGDGAAGDHVYGGELPAPGTYTNLRYQLSATDVNGLSTRMPCEPVVLELQSSLRPRLFINELMAKNDGIIADEFGESDDWIELYNGDALPVWLGDKYLSDKSDRPDKCLLPDTTLMPGEFLLIWADEQQAQGPLHANFKLDKEGEWLGLFDAEATGFQPLDTLRFGPQAEAQSWGRKTDGDAEWVAFSAPTPGYSNSGTPGNEMPFVAYPNPVSGPTLYFNRPASVRVYNAMGQLVIEKNDSLSIAVSQLQAGIYFLSTRDGHYVKILVR